MESSKSQPVETKKEPQEYLSSIPLPKIESILEEHDMLKFNISNTNVSIVNGLRRTIMADIDIAVLDTSDESIVIEHNTTMFNNEILKHVEKIIGPNFFCWNSVIFHKHPNSTAFVSMHQDQNYWGIIHDKALSVQLAISNSTEEEENFRETIRAVFVDGGLFTSGSHAPATGGADGAARAPGARHAVPAADDGERVGGALLRRPDERGGARGRGVHAHRLWARRLPPRRPWAPRQSTRERRGP